MTIALDLFAGHGWGVACRELGIEEYGVEIMPEACAVREANGMQTMYHDVWSGLVEDDEGKQAFFDEYDLLIASPPCQTFSMAGGGAGRKALDEVLAAIDARLYLDPAALVAFGETHDPKTALVLAPLAHIARDTPTFVVLEQVPPVLPVWERYAEEMRRWGYSVWTGNLQAEMYGVPQTRKRAILIARADGKEAKAPTPTHSRYYSRDPQRLDEGVLPWVSMAEALGWGMTERPMITAENAAGRAEGVGGSGAKAAINREKDRGAFVQRGEAEQVRTGMGKGMIERHGERPGRDVTDPAFTVMAGTGGNSQPGFGVRPIMMRSNYSAGGAKGSTAEERGRTMRHEDQPSVAMAGKPGHWVTDEGVRPAPTVTGGGAATGGAETFGRHGRDIVEAMPDAPDRATRVTVAEAAILQSYPADFRWDVEVADPKTGRMKPITKTNTFLQVGNAVPPKLAEAILREVLS